MNFRVFSAAFFDQSRDVGENTHNVYVCNLSGINLTLVDMSDEHEFDDDQGLAIEEARPKLKRPPMYKVVLLNDDYTPMEFVVQILETFFSMDREKATRVMLNVHTKGKGVCGIFTRDVAETKVKQVNEYSRNHQHPLLCDLEEA